MSTTKTPLCLHCKKNRVYNYGILIAPFCRVCNALKGGEWNYCAEPDCLLWAADTHSGPLRGKCSLHGGQTFRDGKHP